MARDELEERTLADIKERRSRDVHPPLRQETAQLGPAHNGHWMMTRAMVNQMWWNTISENAWMA